ncbi:MAG: alpha-glucosidase C-terminal domain-containing protein [Bacteroidales bacterium]
MADDNDEELDSVLAYVREYGDDKVLVVQNLSDREYWIKSPIFNGLGFNDLLGKSLIQGKEAGYLLLKPFQYSWIQC